MECHKCKHRDDPDRLPICMACRRPCDPPHRSRPILVGDAARIRSPEPAGRPSVAGLPQDAEDRFINAIISIFGLDPVDLLLVQHRINGGRTSSFGSSAKSVARRILGYRGPERARAFAAGRRISESVPILGFLFGNGGSH